MLYAALGLGIAAAMTRGTNSYGEMQAEKVFPPLGSFITLDHGRVHYVQKGVGPDLVLLHGAGGNLREFTFDLMDRLTDRYRVTVFDRPGLGYSDNVPGYDPAIFRTDAEGPVAQAKVLRMAAAALGLTRPLVGGHSYGGIVAYAWANLGLDEDSPVNASAVVSLAGVTMPWPGALAPYYRINGSLLGGAFTIPLISAFVPDSIVRARVDSTFAPQAAPEGYKDYIGAQLTLRRDNLRANIRQVNTLRPHVVEIAKRYPELKLPIEIIHGTADTTVPISIHAEEVIKIVPSAHLNRLDGVGHMPHHVAPDVTLAAIDRAATRAGLR